MSSSAPPGPRVPSDLLPPGRAALSVTWAGLPLLTLGWATPITFTFAAIWRRKAHLVAAAAGYVGVLALQLVLLGDLEDGFGRQLFGACVFVQAVVGCVHAGLVRRRVFDPDGVAATAAGNELAIEQARRQRELRRQARELAAGEPGLAKELGIGRPDLPRRYDDGGLVDVNHAPGQALALLPGLTPRLVARIEQVRAEAGGFISAEELATLADLPPQLTGDLAEYAIFLP